MKLHTEFVRLPLRVDADRLALEVAGLADDLWRPHPQGQPGNSAVPLVASGGDPEDDATKGPMLPTPVLASMPYTRAVLGALAAPVGRTRLMRIDEEAEVTAHSDTNYYWWEHVRVHVPVVTTPSVAFHCDEAVVHMEPGEVWAFDTWRRHRVVNAAPSRRIHLVIDTVGSAEFWRRLAADDADVLVVGDDGPGPTFERVNHPVVMSPWELRSHLGAIVGELLGAPGVDPAVVGGLVDAAEPVLQDWRARWALHGDGPTGWEAFADLQRRLDAAVAPFASRLRLTNAVDGVEAIRQLAIRPAVSPSLSSWSSTPGQASPPVSGSTDVPSVAGPQSGPVRRRRRIERPVFVVSPPRSGSSLLFETLAQSPEAWTIGGESHRLIEQIPGLDPRDRGHDSNRLEAVDATPTVVDRLHAAFLARLRDRTGARPPAAGPLRVVEKTPKNSLRIPFLVEAFPDAQFVYLYRDPRETLSSMMDAWRSDRFVTYHELPGWKGLPWSLLLVPGWRDVSGRTLQEMVAHQWATTTSHILDDLAALDPERWSVASYGRLVTEPQAEIERLCAFADLAWDRELTSPLPQAQHTLDAPDPDKWRRNEAEIEEVWPQVADVARRAHDLFAHPPETRPRTLRTEVPRRAPVGPATPAVAAEQPFRSVHTDSVPKLLEQLGSSLLVSTYQSGRVIVCRARDGELNTHFRFFPSPMGMAVGKRSLAIGTARSVWEYRNQPAVAQKLEPHGTHDACFLPKRSHVTGDIRIHEIAYVGDELWMCNTRFSCLATLDEHHSFVPRWKPPFISQLAPEDRCHLNGMAIADGQVRYVTVMGDRDEPGGWRSSKVGGGIVIEVPSGEPVVRGLSMPHSPRWHAGKLWVLDSGRGEVLTVDVQRGTKETVAELPGFTRGLAFAGPFAFVGLSQVRERVFADLPLSERLTDRLCGVWVIDTRDGSTVGFLRFEGAVQEIFDLQLLHGLRYPELAEAEAEVVAGAFVLPDEALALVPTQSR